MSLQAEIVSALDGERVDRVVAMLTGLSRKQSAELVSDGRVVLDGSVTQGIAVVPTGHFKTISVEHPTGEFSVALEIDPTNPQNVLSAALLRTARLIMRGEVMVPAALYR